VAGEVQQRLATAAGVPLGVAHLEQPDTAHRLAQTEAKLRGVFPADAAVTFAGALATRASGMIACVYVATYRAWLGTLLLIGWALVRRYCVPTICEQATAGRGQTSTGRRAWYLLGVATRPRDAKEVRLFGLAPFLRDGYRDHQVRAVAGIGTAGKRVRRRLGSCAVLVTGAYLVAFGLVADDARRGALDLRAFSTLLTMLVVSVSTGSVTAEDISLRWMHDAWTEIAAVESELGEQRVPPLRALPDASPTNGPICFEGVSFRYPNAAAEVIDHLELELPTGRCTALVGLNGAGKSTLVNLLCRLREPTAGAVTAGGVDLRRLDPHRWQRNVALMQQVPIRHAASIRDNIAFGAVGHRDDHDGIEQVARAAGLLEVVAGLPDGWDTVLSPEFIRGVDLSGGQWQRVALARALFAVRHGARVLVLDEPTAALDVRAEAAFYRRFVDLTRGLTTVLISHRFATVRRADKICVLAGGKVSESGTHDELMAGGGTYAHMYHLQAAHVAARP
jgi:ATP-binding cassette subfamily B protein